MKPNHIYFICYQPSVFTNHIYIYKEDLALNNLQRLIWQERIRGQTLRMINGHMMWEATATIQVRAFIFSTYSGIT